MNGSSPLARGAPGDAEACCDLVRLIPARAGSTPNAPLPGQSSAAHPRSHREHTKTDTTHPLRPGSSPLARGTLLHATAQPGARRLIPARAGNTEIAEVLAPQTAAHPRSRGEHVTRFSTRYPSFGSSPLARGPPIAALVVANRPGLIPARAGTTRHGDLRATFVRAHPRSRGDHLLRISTMEVFSGSSPLARGPL